uniref:Transmembrane protein n=1 Tax=Cannabis sativa TaxID=3483 RepID=A0A803RBP1_CANSA
MAPVYWKSLWDWLNLFFELPCFGLGFLRPLLGGRALLGSWVSMVKKKKKSLVGSKERRLVRLKVKISWLL